MPKISLEQWKQHYEQFQASSLSISRYAKMHGIPASSFHSAITRLKKQQLINPSVPDKPQFIQLTTDKIDNPPSVPEMNTINLCLPSGVKIELNGGDNNSDSIIEFITTLDRSLRTMS